MRRLVPTPHITTGPFFPAQFVRPEDSNLRRGDAASETPMTFVGQVRDADGKPCVNAILEIWQPDRQDRFVWGRTWTDEAGRYRFDTFRSGALNGRAPHIDLTIHASGLMRPLVTQIYFPEEPRNERDPQLLLVPAERRQLLVARATDAPPGALCFDIALGGPGETPFFED